MTLGGGGQRGGCDPQRGQRGWCSDPLEGGGGGGEWVAVTHFRGGDSDKFLSTGTISFFWNYFLFTGTTFFLLELLSFH